MNRKWNRAMKRSQNQDASLKSPARKSTVLKSDLARVIEPLASYICAADRPKEILRAALSALCDEVHDTNRAALTHVLWNRADRLDLVA
jgi:hypothetical protein